MIPHKHNMNLHDHIQSLIDGIKDVPFLATILHWMLGFSTLFLLWLGTDADRMLCFLGFPDFNAFLGETWIYVSRIMGVITFLFMLILYGKKVIDKIRPVTKIFVVIFNKRKKQ
jgi:hypothetical protein